MGLQLASPAWVEAWRDAINASDAYHESGAHWQWPLGLAFLGEGDLPTRYLYLDCDHGVCRDARVVDEATFEAAPYGLSAPYSRWAKVLRGDVEAIRALITGRITLRGDLATVVRYVTCAKAVLDAARNVDTESLTPSV